MLRTDGPALRQPFYRSFFFCNLWAFVPRGWPMDASLAVTMLKVRSGSNAAIKRGRGLSA